MTLAGTYRTPDSKQHWGEIAAVTKEAAYAALRAQGIKAGHVDEAPGVVHAYAGAWLQ